MQKKTIKQLGPEYRPDEKYLKFGPKALTDAELLAIILRTGSSDEHSVDLASRILKLGGLERENVLNPFRFEVNDLMKLKGVGLVKALQIKALCELSLRIAQSSTQKNLRFCDPESVAAHYMERLRHEKTEVVIMLALDSANQLLKEVEISSGTVNASLLAPREIFLEAVKCEAVNIILLHNHPSGLTNPSSADVESTKRIKQAGQLMGIRLEDHLIIGDMRYLSFKEEGLI